VAVGLGRLLYAPQSRSDTVVGERTFDRSIFPAIAIVDPQGDPAAIKYFPHSLATSIP
jgi:hypothetical protein